MSWQHEALLGFDLETDGLSDDCRPVSFALVDWNGRVVKARHGLINPERPIPEEVTKIHGITDADVAERGGDLERSVRGIAGQLMLTSETRVPVVGANLRFDLSIVDRLYRGYNDGRSLRDDGWNGIVIDVSVIDRHVDKFRKGSRKLSALCEHYGVPLEKAHTAAADAIGAVQVAVAIAEKYAEIGHADPEVLHVLQAAWRREWVSSFNEYRRSKDQEPIPEDEGNWPLATDTEVVV